MELALKIICYILSTLLGLAVGSFLNVCIYRLPIGKFWSSNRSYCPKCGTPIKAYDNIPLLSYIILKGRCRACHERISPRYPIIEALNMVLWIVNFAVFGMTWSTIIYDILVSTLIVVAMIDFDTTEIPDSSIIAIIIMGLLTFIPVFGMDWKSKLIGAFCVSVPMFVLAFFGLMGMGDVKLFFALGLLFGWEKILIIFLISFVLGAVVGLINYVHIRRRGEALAGEEDADVTIAKDTDGENIDAVDGTTKPITDIENNVEISTTVSINVDEKGDSIPNTAMADSVETCRDMSSAVEGTDTDEAGSDTKREKRKIALDMTASDEEFEADLEEKLESGHALAFGPFIAIAGAIALYFGDAIVGFYMRLMGF